MRKLLIKKTLHDVVILVFLALGCILLWEGEANGAIIFLLAMIEDSVYKK